MPDSAIPPFYELHEAITELRVRNPELRPAVLSSLRLAATHGHLKGGRLYSLRFDGEVAAIIAHGPTSQDEQADRTLLRRAVEAGEPVGAGAVVGYPLGRGEQRVHGVLLLEEPLAESGQFLADLFWQWHAVADFVNNQREELVDENFHLREEIKQQFHDHKLIGISGPFRHLVEQARRVAPSTATVMLQGETGTGKELLARLIHDYSTRANQAFVSVNCGALAESLLETELFGHVKGAFTGAISDHKGRFETANEGTIFLDEIGEISQAMQVRLLRVLQEMEVVRVGDSRVRKLDVRVIAATNRDLEAEVREGRFRADLFYRLNVVHLNVPPLRNRTEDIPLLVEHFLSEYCQRNFKYIESVSRDVLQILQGYAWPGNVRELENCIEKMVVMAPGRQITTELLPMALVAFAGDADEAAAPHQDTFEAMLKRWMQGQCNDCLQRGSNELYDRVRGKWERHLFEVVLASCRNNKSKAARLLGITRNTLNARLDTLSDVKREWKVD